MPWAGSALEYAAVAALFEPNVGLGQIEHVDDLLCAYPLLEPMCNERPHSASAWIFCCSRRAASLALRRLFVGEPDDRMLAALFQTWENLKAELAETFSAEVAAAIAEAFLATVGRRASTFSLLRSGSRRWSPSSCRIRMF
jgi:hypothetical protein